MAAAPGGASSKKIFSRGYQYYALGLLLTVYVFNFIDRSILAILIEPIKHDLKVSDSALGFLGGLAFALFYTALGVPIARLADKRVRRNILVVCISIWSGMTALCGFAQNYVQLLLTRIGVAVGEAGGSPPSHSMISDIFPLQSRATALGIYALGIPVGSMIGTLAGGWINDAFDWRTAFRIVGVPGLLLAVIVRLTLREPPRGAADGLVAATAQAPPVADVIRGLWSRVSFRWLALGAGLHALPGYGTGAWNAPFFQRSHHMTTTDIGVAFFWLGIPAAISTFLGGYLADRLGRRDVRWYVWLAALAVTLSIAPSIFCYLWPDHVVVLWVWIVPALLGSFWLAPAFSLTQGLVGLRMRAVAASIMLFTLNIIGLGLGPWSVGVVSDLLNAYTTLGTESLRWSLVISTCVSFAACFCYVQSGVTLKSDLARSHELG
jgi:MFS family permease